MAIFEDVIIVRERVQVSELVFEVCCAKSISELFPLLLHFFELSCFDVIDETMKLDRCIFGSEVWRLCKILHVIFNGLLQAEVICQ